MGKYAENTEVSCDRSRMEIERTLSRYGAEQFAYAAAPGKAMVGFIMCRRQVRFLLPLPSIEEFKVTPTGRARAQSAKETEYEKACRQRWRALALVIKAKLEAIECGISEFEQEFMANIVLPGGGTVGEFMTPQIAAAYDSGEPPKMLPMLGGR